MLNYNHLYYFYVFVQEGSVVQAARKLSISQPALSAQLRLFEQNLGEEIFSRAGRRLELTEQGKTVFNYARQMFSLSEDLWEQLKRPTSSQGIRLHLGVTDQVARHLAVDMVSPLYQSKRQDRQIMIHVSSDPHETLVERLRNRSLDVALSNQPAFYEGIETLAQIKMPVLMCAHRSFRETWGGKKNLLDKNILGIIKLFAVGFVVPASGFRLRDETNRFFEELKISPRVVLETDHIASLQRAVSNRTGICLLPYPYVSRLVKTGRIITFGPKTGYWQHSVWLLGRRSEALRPIYAELAKTLTQQTAEP